MKVIEKYINLIRARVGEAIGIRDDVMESLGLNTLDDLDDFIGALSGDTSQLARLVSLSKRAKKAIDDFNSQINEANRLNLVGPMPPTENQRLASRANIFSKRLAEQDRANKLMAAAKSSFYGNKDPLEYLYPKNNRWLGYNPNIGPLADIFRAEEQGRANGLMERAKTLFYGGKDPLAYMRKPENRWVGYNPEATPLADRFRAEETARKDKEDSERRARERTAERRSHRRAFIYDSLSDFDQRRHDLLNRYGHDKAGRDMADKQMRKEILKDLPGIFNNSKTSTKALYDLKDSIGKVPYLSKLMKHPFLALGGAAFAATQQILSASDRSNDKVIQQGNAAFLYGSPSSAFRLAMARAGITDVGKQTEIYGKFQHKFGPATEQMLGVFGNLLATAPSGFLREQIASSLGISNPDIATALYMFAGNEAPNFGKPRNIVARKGFYENQAAQLMMSGSGFVNTIRGWGLSFDINRAMEARGAENNKSLPYGQMSEHWEYIDNVINNSKSAEDAAESLKVYELRNHNEPQGAVPASSNTVSMNIGTMNVGGNPDSIKSLLADMKDNSDGGAFVNRLAVADAFDPHIRA